MVDDKQEGPSLTGVTIRFDAAAIDAADLIAKTYGADSRALVMRRACAYGLSAFLKDVTLFPKASELKIELPTKGEFKIRK